MVDCVLVCMCVLIDPVSGLSAFLGPTGCDLSTYRYGMHARSASVCFLAGPLNYFARSHLRSLSGRHRPEG